MNDFVLYYYIIIFHSPNMGKSIRINLRRRSDRLLLRGAQQKLLELRLVQYHRQLVVVEKVDHRMLKQKR